ncbi:MAG: nucleoside monophosphate kinase [bacterium]|nr:nucleoside monophosphate kinase [bacterium]
MTRLDRKPLNIMLLGDVASGKGTQAARLAKRYKLYDLDMGRELRREKDRFDYSKTAARGILTPTKYVRRILKNKIESMPPRQGILFDGTPKMIGEARLVVRLLKQAGRKDPICIYVSIPVQEIIKRAQLRVDYKGKRVIRREDDRPEAVRNRLRYYGIQKKKVAAYFRSKYGLAKISGLGTKAQVYARIVKHIESRLK